MEGEKMENRLMTKYEVMKYLNISRRYFERLVEEGQLPVIKISQNKRYVRSEDLNRYLNTKMINKPTQTLQEVHPEEEFEWKNIWSKR